MKENLLAMEIVAKGGIKQMNPVLIAVITEIIVVLLKECNLTETKVMYPNLFDRIRLKWIIRAVNRGREDKDLIYDLLLNWATSSDRMVVRSTLDSLK